MSNFAPYFMFYLKTNNYDEKFTIITYEHVVALMWVDVC